MAKEFDIYLNKSPKGFDIYLNKRLTECDILVYSIPIRDGITTMNRIILEGCVESLILMKFIAAQTESTLISHIDDTLKTCYEMLNCGADIDVSADFQTHFVIAPFPNHIEIETNELRHIASMFTNAENSIRIAESSICAGVTKFAGNGHSEIAFDANITDTLKRGIESARTSMCIGAYPITTNAKGFIGASIDIETAAELSDLCYSMYNAAGSILELSAIVIGTELMYSFGHGWSGLLFRANVSSEAEKYIAIETAVSLLANVTEKAQKYINQNGNDISFDVEASFFMRRFRALSEMDENALLYYDNIALDEVDYVELGGE